VRGLVAFATTIALSAGGPAPGTIVALHATTVTIHYHVDLAADGAGDDSYIALTRADAPRDGSIAAYAFLDPSGDGRARFAVLPGVRYAYRVHEQRGDRDVAGPARTFRAPASFLRVRTCTATAAGGEVRVTGAALRVIPRRTTVRLVRGGRVLRRGFLTAPGRFAVALPAPRDPTGLRCRVHESLGRDTVRSPTVVLRVR
jgi:hypothetical protein